jgi:hypothetical protein
LKSSQTAKKSKSEARQIDRAVESSPIFLKLADSILDGFDRRTAGEMVAGYLYFMATGRTDADFGRFLLANRLDVVLRMVGNSLPVLIPAFFSDRQLRSLIADLVVRSLKGSGSKQ